MTGIERWGSSGRGIARAAGARSSLILSKVDSTHCWSAMGDHACQTESLESRIQSLIIFLGRYNWSMQEGELFVDGPDGKHRCWYSERTNGFWFYQNFSIKEK